ncbi:V-type ATPase subunit [Demequina zhanjiangensis]|uniref:V-type ATPase subunit n=1 Tax=Demequina zhanjiangensis TaxID=3051659 RepID=A0ABT8FYP1_9MICO|nr:V-type ATPase subunit [Demequina sp. SYSU T00b26]MDN4471933.1 V-type ATPase subunit [Demequina sp. SYSU T00b26]
MSISWVAATVRVRALAAGRAGRAGAARLAQSDSLDDAADLLSRWSYGARLGPETTATALQRSVRETLLWQLRVLAGWAPANGTGILRGAAAEFERDNILMRMRELQGGPAERPFELGALETSWSTLRHASNADSLLALLARTPWGEVPADEQDQLADILTATWLGRYAAAAPGAQAWAARRAAILTARARFVDGLDLAPTLRRRLRPLLGTAWESTTDLPAFAASLPSRVRAALAGTDDASGLWSAESHLYALMDDEASSLLRTGTPRPESLVAGLALLTVDAWRIQAAIAAVESGQGAKEVLDAAS